MSFLDEREQQLGFRPQHENKYSSLFRGIPDFDAKSLSYFKTIKNQLKLSIAENDDERALAWMTNLAGYLNIYELKFDRSDHIELVHLCYNLLCVPGIPTDLLHQTGICISFLLRKSKILSPEDLNLDWKPLYDVINYYHVQVEPSDRMKNVVYWNHLRQASKLRYYFKETATQEIFESQIENLCPFSPAKMKQSLFILTALLPTRYTRGKETAYQVWFEPLMTLWQSLTQKDVEWEIMEIMANFSFHNPGVIDWTPYMSFIYSRIIAFTGGTGKNAKNNRDGRLNMTSCARWIVSTLGGRQNGQKYLDKFMPVFRTCKKNSERFSSPLENLIKNIISLFWTRIWLESGEQIPWTSPIPDDIKINDNDIDAFIDAIFSTFVESINLMHLIKDPDVIAKLTSLRPKVVIPRVIASFDEAFSDICFPNKYWSILESITSIVHACVYAVKNGSFPEGVELLVPLLTKILSYEPITSLVTVLSTFSAVSSFFSLVPIVDTSTANIDSEFTEIESLVNSNSSAYEEIALKILDVVFGQISSLQHIQTRLDSETKTLDVSEQIQSAVISGCFGKLLFNVSPQIFQSMIDKYKRFVFSEVKETNFAGAIIGKIGKSFTKTDPETTLKVLVPDLVSEIVSCLDSYGNLVDDRSESDLVYYLRILADVIDCESPRIKPWVPLICTIFPTTLLKCDLWDCLESSAACLTACFSALSSVSVEHESVLKRYENSNICPLEDWGLRRSFKDLKFNFITPGAEEKELIDDLIERFVWPQVEFLEGFCEQDDKYRDPVRRALLVVGCLMPLFDVTPRWEEPPLFETPDDSEQSESVTYPLQCLDITFPGNKNLRKTILKVLTKTADKIIQVDEHSVKALTSLIHILGKNLAVGFKFELVKTFAKERDWPLVLKNSDPKVRGQSLVYYAFKLKTLRSEMNIIGHERVTETHRDVILCLMKLAMTDYRSVQFMAIQILSFLESFPVLLGASNVIYPQIKANLMLNPVMDSPEYKGSVDMVIQCCKDLTSPKVLKSGLLPLLFKPKELDESVVRNYFSKLSVKIERCSRGSQKLSCSLSNNGLKTAKDWTDVYNEALDDLLSLDFRSVDGLTLPWNFEVLLLSLLKLLDYPDRTLPLRAFKFVLSKLFSDLQPVHNVAVKVAFLTIRSLKKMFAKKVCIKTSDVMEVSDSWEFGEDELTDRIQYMADSRLMHGGNELFVHNNHVGFTKWPSEIKVSINWELDEDYPGAVESAFTPAMTKKFITTACARSSSSYSQINARFYGHLFTLCPAVVDRFITEVTELFVSNPDEIIICACSEIICGILKSMKYWPSEMRNERWPRLLYAIDLGINWKVHNSLAHWGQCFSHGLVKTDPQMLCELYALLMDWTFDDSSFSADLSKKIYFLATVFHNFSWRLAHMNSTLIQKISSYIGHESQIIRNEIAKLLSVIFNSDVEFNGKRSSRSPKIEEFINNLVVNDCLCLIEELPENDRVISQRIHARRTLTTVCRWMICFFKNRCPVHPDMYELVPLLSYTSSKIELEWEELKLISSEVLQTLAKQTLTSLDYNKVFPNLMKSFSDLKVLLKGKARVEFIRFLQVFVFFARPHIIFSDHHVDQLRSNTLLALKDDHIDVRLASKRLLADLIHFKIFTDVDETIDLLITMSSNRIIDDVPGTVIMRQAAILGLLAFLSANPDDVPDYLTRIFEVLSRYSNDSHPVGQWIGKEVSDFMLLHENTRKKVEEVISRDVLDDFGGTNLPYFS